MVYLQLLFGFGILIFSGNYLVKGGVSLAQDLKISKLVIGITIIAFGTSAPELFVSIIAALSGHVEIAIGNVVGSNITNIALVLALTTIIFPLTINKYSVHFDWFVMMLASALFYLFITDSKLQFFEGLIFLSLLSCYVIYSVRTARKKFVIDDEEPQFQYTAPIAILLVLISSCGLALGSSLLVDSASEIALHFGVSERVTSITVIAFGTSLPELTTSLTAAFRKESDISIGNIIGSNIFNILGVLGIASVIKDIDIAELTRTFDIVWMLSISALLLFSIVFLRDGKIRTSQGVLLFTSYCVYIFLLFTTTH